MWLLRLISSIVFLFLIVFTIPLTFDVGGKDCGLAFSLALSTYYFFYSVLQLVTPNQSRFRFAFGQFVKYTQWVTILILMIWSLNVFSIDSDNADGGWVERTFHFKRARDTSVQLWLFGRHGLVPAFAIGGWDKLLRYSTPVFQILEGFCSLLVIQAGGQITRWLVNRERGDTWMVSSCISDDMDLLKLTADRFLYSEFLLVLFQALFTSFGESPRSQRLELWTPSSSAQPLLAQ
jgi:hypothetical protein